MAHTHKKRSSSSNHRKVRPRRAGTPTPVASYKTSSSSEASRQYKKRQLRKQQLFRKRQPQQDGQDKSAKPRTARPTRRAMLAVIKAKRERWAGMAAETQEIVLGDGKYVEERCVSLVSPSLAQSEHKGPEELNTDHSEHIVHDISIQVELSRQGTAFYPHYSQLLANWAEPRPASASTDTIIQFTRQSTLTAARHLWQDYPHLRAHNASSLMSTSLGVFSFASPKKPGGGFLHGGDEQEEIIARLSSLVASLSAPVAKEFYQEHKKYRAEDGSGLHDHSMVYAPGVVVFRKDLDDTPLADDTSSPPPQDNVGGEFIAPYMVNVLSSVPVNASMVRKKHVILPSEEQLFEDGIRSAMKERMARALRVFEERGDKVLVLGAFGCGSSENKPEVIARIWAELLVCGDVEEDEEGGSRQREARFKHSFERVVFAVPGKLHGPFKKAFEMRIFEEEVQAAAMDER